MKKFRLLLLVNLMFFFLSCEKQNQENESHPIKNNCSKEYDEDFATLAQALSKSMNNLSFRETLKEEAMKKFDGDFDILLLSVENKEVESDLKSTHSFLVKELLEENFPTVKSKSRLKSGNSIIDELIKKYPNLQFSIPVNCENWNLKDYEPVVTFLPSDYDEATTKTLIGYKSDGSTVILDAVKRPEVPVIVVSENERVEVQQIIDPGDPSDPVIVPQPYNLVANQSESGIRITWSMPSGTNISNTTGYYIYRKSSNDGVFMLIHTNNYHVNRSYDDLNVTAGASYSYFVIAFNEISESDPTNYVTQTAPNRPKPVQSFDALYISNDEVELRWENDHSQYISETVVQKRLEGSPYSVLKSFTADENNYLDYALERGKKYIYKIEHKTPLGTSNAKWDFVQIPYRSISYASPVYILGLSFTDWSLERWPAGAPEFYVAVSSANPKDQKAYTIQEQIDLRFPFMIESCPFSSKVFDWYPSTWYDVLTFTVIEYDRPSQSTKVDVGVGYNSKKKDESAGLNFSGSIAHSVTFTDNGEKCGNAYYHYFDASIKEIVFPNYGVKLLIGDSPR